jgi:hypothetical protein
MDPAACVPGPRREPGVLDRFGTQIRAIGGSVDRGAIGRVGATESREGSRMGQELEPYSDRMRRCCRTDARKTNAR